MAALLAAPVAVHDGGNIGGERDALGRPVAGGHTESLSLRAFRLFCVVDTVCTEEMGW